MGVTVSWEAARSPSPVGFARQPTLGALDRNAVTGERIPVQPGCQQFIVQVGAVLGVRDATLTAEVLQPVLGFLPQVAEEAQVGPVSPLAGQAAVTERQAEQPAEPLIGQQRIIRRRRIMQAPGRDNDAIAVPGWCNRPVDCSYRKQ